ncbi:uncharacterized protein LOC127279141 [Leptopilina boulardi]|uniref:uncharacterized protein LOC127279141 n=1 Tax=Leptopilina boulardi TaxID=63433 RepID=UPI0021F52CB1|nr:uncharacterized protein LOC127279141 [Leptopilina boulardi]
MALPKLCDYFLPKTLHVETLTQDQLTVLILQKATETFKPRTTSMQRSDARNIVQLFQAGTSVEETKPKANEPPRLIAIGNIDAPNLTFSVYADQHAMFVVSAVESLIHLYALF